MQRELHPTLADDIKEQAEVWLQTAKERIEELDTELRDMHKLERERSELLQQVEQLAKILSIEPHVMYVKTERTKQTRGRKNVTPDGRPIADHIAEILEEEHPGSLHWKGILRKLNGRGIGEYWKSPLASIRMAIKRDERVTQLLNGEFTLAKEYLTGIAKEAAASKDESKTA